MLHYYIYILKITLLNLLINRFTGELEFIMKSLVVQGWRYITTCQRAGTQLDPTGTYFTQPIRVFRVGFLLVLEVDISSMGITQPKLMILSLFFIYIKKIEHCYFYFLVFCHKNINQRKPNFSNDYRYKIANPRESIELADEPFK